MFQLYSAVKYIFWPWSLC